MPVDTSSPEFLLLLRQFEKGQVVLFAGAGFSLGATNRRGEEPPDARALAEGLANECGWPYGGEDLSVIYAQAESHLGASGVRSFLASLYANVSPAAWQYDVNRLYWYRIYTTNIDDVLERVFQQNPAQAISSIVCPAAFVDADPWYETVQCIHLHGSILDSTKPLTFTLEAYAEQTSAANPWYQQLAEDMQSKSVVFVGTRLAESPYYHYLALRTKRASGEKEVRAKGFIVAPQNSPILRREFDRQGYAVIDATAEEFFAELIPKVQTLVQSNVDIIRTKNPHLVAAIAAGILDAQSDLLRDFEFVSVFETDNQQAPRSMFLLGAEPTWADIAYNIDAPRGISRRMQDILTGPPEGLNIVSLMGPAGSGKSTCLRRVAYELTRDGQTVYFAKGQKKWEINPLVDLAGRLEGRRAFVFIDDVVTHIERLNDVLTALPKSHITFVVADQSHLLAPRLEQLKLKPWRIESMPSLDQKDCEAILDKLEHFGYLGVLTGRPRNEQLNAFLIRSRKQLLVAMKEATSGKGFDVIIAQEYGTLASDSAKLAYVVACVVYAQGPAVRRRHLLACLEGNDYEKARVIKEQLVDVLVPWHESEEHVIPRHRVIARQVATEAAPRDVVREAIVRFIGVVAAEITPQNITRRTLEYQAFRGVLRFDNMRLLFGDAYDLIESIYREVKPYCDKNFLYWLQRGRLEVHFDNFETVALIRSRGRFSYAA